MRTLALLLAAVLCALPGHAQDSKRTLWTWTDANGVTHFSDRPEPGARRVELSGVEAPAGTGAPTAAAASPSSRAEPAAPVEYTLLEIWQPEEDESFFGADARVDVRMRLEPELAAGHRLVLYLDGKLQEGAGSSLEYALTDLERGVHSLTAMIVDAQGKELFRSERRVFSVRQPTVIPPRAVGPALQPKPAPTPAPRPNTPKG